MKFKDTNNHRAGEDIAEVIRLLAEHAPSASIKSDAPRPGVARAFYELATSAKCLERGEIMTRITQIHASKAPVLMEYINGGGPYAARHPGLLVTLRNNGKKTIEVKTDEIRHYDVDPDGIEKMDSWVTEFLCTDVAPGETIELTPHYAFIVMYEYTKRSWPPQHWNKWESMGFVDCFEEVGYRCRLAAIDEDHPTREVSAPVKARRKAS